MIKIFDLKLSDIPDGYSADDGILATNTSISIFSDDPLVIEPVLNEQIPAWVEAIQLQGIYYLYSHSS